MTGHYIPFTADQLDHMRSLYDQGHSSYAIADRFGICRKSVLHRLHSMGVQVRRRGRPSKTHRG